MILKAIHVGQCGWKKPHWASRGSFHATQTRNAHGDRIQCSLKNLLLFLNTLLDSFAQEQVYLSSISIIPLYKLLYIRRTGFLQVGNVSIQLMSDPFFWAPLDKEECPTVTKTVDFLFASPQHSARLCNITITAIYLEGINDSTFSHIILLCRVNNIVSNRSAQFMANTR